jgi:hypothetical protein
MVSADFSIDTVLLSFDHHPRPIRCSLGMQACADIAGVRVSFQFGIALLFTVIDA